MLVRRSAFTVFLSTIMFFLLGFLTSGCIEKHEPQSEPAPSSQLSSSRDASEENQSSPTDNKPILQILVGNENRAELANCGCGGSEPLSISRKIAALKRFQIEGIPFLSIERSYLSHPGTKETRVANEYQNKVYVNVLQMWNCDVLLPAGRDLYCTKDEFTDIHKDITIPIVLTNADLKFECSNVKKFTIFNIADWRLMILNVVKTGKEQEEYADFEFTDPKKAVEKELKSNEGKFDEAIVFADMDMAPSVYSDIAGFENVLLVFGDSHQKLDDDKLADYLSLEEVGNSTFLPFTIMPGEIEIINLFGNQTGLVTGFSVMKSTINESDACDEVIEKYITSELKKLDNMRRMAYSEYARNNPDKVRDYKKADNLLKPAKWAGSFACFDCHIVQAENWKDSKHSKAFISLAAKNKSSDVECIVCHSIGFMDSGFTIDGKESKYAGVGCESCHGPGEWHRKMRMQAKESTKNGESGKTVEPVKPPADWDPSPGEEVCIKCHQDMHDPDFDFATKIRFVTCNSEAQ